MSMNTLGARGFSCAVSGYSLCSLQNLRRNEQAGGGAYVLRLKSTAQETEFATEVLHRVRVTLAECENEMHMSGDFEN